MTQYATSNNFKVLGTWFLRKDIYKGTWKIPGPDDTNQIEHVLISKRWSSDIENIRTYWGANSDSDHFLVKAKVKQKLAVINFQQNVEMKLETNPTGNDVEEEWTHIKETILKTVDNVVGEKKNKIKWWVVWWRMPRCNISKKKSQARTHMKNTIANKNEYNRSYNRSCINVT